MVAANDGSVPSAESTSTRMVRAPAATALWEETGDGFCPCAGGAMVEGRGEDTSTLGRVPGRISCRCGGPPATWPAATASITRAPIIIRRLRRYIMPLSPSSELERAKVQPVDLTNRSMRTPDGQLADGDGGSYERQ